jgi:hypothetical protein
VRKHIKNKKKNHERCHYRENSCNIMFLFRNCRGLLQYVVHIAMDAQFVAICNRYCNTMNLWQKLGYCDKHVFGCKIDQNFATIYVSSATHQNCCSIFPNITTKICFVAIPSLYCNKKVNSCNTIELSQYCSHIAMTMQFVGINGFIATKRVVSATKLNCGNTWILLPRTGILW